MLNDFASFLVLWILFPTFPFSRLFYYSLGLFIIHYQPLMHVFDHALVIIIATISCFYLYNLPFFTLLTCHFPLSRAKDFFKTYIMHTLSSSKIIIPFVLYLWLCCYLLCFHILSLSLETQQQQNDAFGSRENLALLCVVLYSNTSLASIFVNFSLLSFLPHQLACSCIAQHQHMYLYIAIPLPYSLTLLNILPPLYIYQHYIIIPNSL